MSAKLALEGEGPWGLPGVQDGRAEALGDDVLLSFNFLRDGHARNYVQLIMGVNSSRKLLESLQQAVKQIELDHDNLTKK